MTPLFAQLAWYWWVLIAIGILVVILGVLKAMVVGSPARAVQYARFLAQSGNLPAAEVALRSAIQQLDAMPWAQTPQAHADRQMLLAALQMLYQNPAAFAAGIGMFVEQRIEQPAETGFEPGGPLRQALLLVQQGDRAGAIRVAEQALAHLPPVSACVAEQAIRRFQLQMLLADLIRKTTADRRRELDLLNDCVPLLVHLPPDPPGDDRFTNQRYLIHINRGVAATALGLSQEAVSAYRDALQAARQPEPRCKCLGYLGCELLRLGVEENRESSRTTLDQFDQEASGQAISPALRALAFDGRAILSLPGDHRAARQFLEESINLEPAGFRQRALELLRQPTPDIQAVIDNLLWPGGRPGAQPRAARPDRPASQPLPPLSEDI
jgi:tetratricopeptide (TPR) repeat protein